MGLRWKCSECSQEIQLEDISRTEEVVQVYCKFTAKEFSRFELRCYINRFWQSIVKNIQRLPVDRHLIDRCEELFLTLPKKIHANHVILLQLRISLVHLYGNVPGFLIPELPVSLLHRKAQLCSELLEALHQLCPGYSRLRGFFFAIIFDLLKKQSFLRIGIVLYELHVPLVCLANQKFESGQMQQDQLIRELKDAEIFLKEAVQILIHEPISTPEWHIARAAMADLKQLRDYISETQNLRRS